jgi:hypothetical protein
LKLSPSQVQLLQALQANPDERVQTYNPVSRARFGKTRCYLTKKHINFKFVTVKALYNLGYLEMIPAYTFPTAESYILSEKGKSYNVN